MGVSWSRPDWGQCCGMTPMSNRSSSLQCLVVHHILTPAWTTNTTPIATPRHPHNCQHHHHNCPQAPTWLGPIPPLDWQCESRGTFALIKTSHLGGKIGLGDDIYAFLQWQGWRGKDAGEQLHIHNNALSHEGLFMFTVMHPKFSYIHLIHSIVTHPSGCGMDVMWKGKCIDSCGTIPSTVSSPKWLSSTTWLHGVGFISRHAKISLCCWLHGRSW